MGNLTKPSGTICFLFLLLELLGCFTHASSSTTAAVTSTNAEVTYPTGTPVINNIDVVEVSYLTNWTNTNMTLFCKTNAATWQWATYEAPMIDQNGTYSLDPVIEEMNIPQFPVDCHFDFQNPHNSLDHALGGDFVMTSTEGAAVTWKQKQPSGTSTQAVQTSASGATAGKASNADGMPSNTASPDSGSDSNSGSSKLSTGAAAGIGVGVAVAAIAGAVSVFFAMRRRNQKKRYLTKEYTPERFPYTEGAPPYTYEDPSAIKAPVESDGQPIYPSQEMDVVQAPIGRNFVAELPTTPVDRRA